MRTFRTCFVFCVSIVLSIGNGSAAELRRGLTELPPAQGIQIKTKHGYMIPYTATIPGTDVKFEMVPVPAGHLMMGSDRNEAGRHDDEGPQVRIEVPAFWIGKYEITWSEYKQFMKMYDLFKAFEKLGVRKLTDKNQADAVTAPSNLYEPETTFTYGESPRLPAVTMSQQAAKQYTKWLSKLTGEVYRLPSEAEWEYACRAGAQSAYAFGNDIDELEKYAWYFKNADETPHEVGQKQPNAWGIYDMHGNVSEWVLDQYSADGYQKIADKTTSAKNAVFWPTKLYPRVLRGGCWYDDAEKLRCAARRPSHDDDWRASDPNRPLSPWWFTEEDSLSVGFRIVRPLETPSKEELLRCWEADIDLIRNDEAARMEQGKGARGLVNPELPEASRAQETP